MPAFWQSAPVGGEFTSSIPMKTMLRSQLSQTVELVQQSHMSFLGPKVAEETYRGGYNAVLKNLATASGSLSSPSPRARAAPRSL